VVAAAATVVATAAAAVVATAASTVVATAASATAQVVVTRGAATPVASGTCDASKNAAGITIRSAVTVASSRVRCAADNRDVIGLANLPWRTLFCRNRCAIESIADSPLTTSLMAIAFSRRKSEAFGWSIPVATETMTTQQTPNVQYNRMLRRSI
jgi:hypothetical protein